MSEREVLAWSLAAGAVGFLVKGIATTVMWWLMRKANGATGLGPALKRQSGALALQAFMVAAIFGYFSRAIIGHGVWVPAWTRIACYLAMAALVVWAALQCVRVVFAYFDELGSENEHANEPTNERQDLRESEQNTRETFQSEKDEQVADVTLRQNTRQNLMDARQVLQDARQKRQENYAEGDGR